MSLSSRSLAAIAVVMLAASLLIVGPQAPVGAAPAIVVDTTSDDGSLSACTSAAGDCSLRGAVDLANTIAAHKTISFAIPEAQCPNGVCRINLSNGPLEIDEAVTVDATTQPRYVGAPANVCATETMPSHMRVELVATFVGPTGFIISNTDGSTTIRGFAIGSGNNVGDGRAIIVDAGDGHHIACNHLGVDAAGSAPLDTMFFGSVVLIDGDASGVVVGTDGDGSDDLAERNVLATIGSAVNVNDNDNNRISGNYIGYSADGTTPILGGTVYVRQTSSNNLIGVEVDGVSDDIEPNYISAVTPIYLWPELYTTSGNRVIGNVIGLTPAGAINPGSNGIVIEGFEPADTGYEIAGNTLVALSNEAINVSGTGSGLIVDGNWIGETPDGTAAGNNTGVYLTGSVSPQVSNNIIANSTDVGVDLVGSAGFGPGSTGNCIMGNTPDGVFNGTHVLTVFEDNWWGWYTGPSGLGSGSGDYVSQDVDFTPWLTTPPEQCNQPPTISDGSLSIRENSPAGALAGHVTSSDDGGTLVHSITAGNTGGVFAINPATGAIAAAGLLDFETTPSYTLTVEVDDGAYTDSATIEITVTNRAPYVHSATFNVSEDAAVGTSVGTVTADDPGATLVYSITAGNDEGLFAIDPATGEITTAAPLQYGPIWSHVVTVAVSDGLLTGTAKVTINVTEVGPTFLDVPETHTFYADIEWLAAEGITRGCNPPDNDLFCPDASVTRGQMAAFLHRALDGVLTPGAAVEFVDDDGSVFEEDIEWLGSVGVTRGCNPPTNDMFCPNAVVTRGQMAAFLVRALGYTAGAGSDQFTDDDGLIFEADIERLAAAGITRGCNPPTNDMFCPNSPVTRGQMAAFLHRALS